MALRLMDDDESALATIIKRYGPAIAIAISRRFGLNEQDAEDVLSIASHRLWEARHRYDDGVATLRTYFYRIAVNAARDAFKHGWQKARALCVDVGAENDVDTIASVDNGPEQCGCTNAGSPKQRQPSKKLKDLAEIIDGLPPAQQHIIRRDSCARDDVACSSWLADELGIAVASVRVYRGRAMETIRRQMRERGHDVP
ncbi:MAG: sigma-70 family RNA polymerase sigma factor [Candidatus Anammoximicrobium sp.]|nr:sigma-70 family RNA polymerase sigma factor [Candidatus Anammoximicrobium sp.]